MSCKLLKRIRKRFFWKCCDLPATGSPAPPKSLPLQFQPLQVFPELPAQVRPAQSVFHRGFEKSELVTGVVSDHRLSAGDAASALGIPIDLIYAAKSRVLKRLRDEVMHLAEDLPQCVPLDD